MSEWYETAVVEKGEEILVKLYKKDSSSISNIDNSIMKFVEILNVLEVITPSTNRDKLYDFYRKKLKKVNNERNRPLKEVEEYLFLQEQCKLITKLGIKVNKYAFVSGLCRKPEDIEEIKRVLVGDLLSKRKPTEEDFKITAKKLDKISPKALEGNGKKVSVETYQAFKELKLAYLEYKYLFFPPIRERIRVPSEDDLKPKKRK